MPEELLHGANIGAAGEEVCGEAVPERVAAGRFGDACIVNRAFNGVLEVLFTDVVPAAFA